MSEEELYHKIELYLSDKMSDEDRLVFEKELENNSSHKEEFELHKQLYSHFEEEYISNEIPDNEYTQELKRFINGDEAKAIQEKLEAARHKYKPKRNKANSKTYIRLVAALILLFIISRVGYEFIKAPNLYDTYYDVNDLPSLVKRNDSQNQLYKGLELFNTSEFDEAIKNFEIYKKSGIQIDSLMFLYLGASHLQLNQYDKAIKNFDIISNSQLLDKSRGLWFKALTYLKADDKEKARPILEDIVKNPANFKYKEAKDLLEEL